MAIFQQEIQSYFATLNPLAERISRDSGSAKDCRALSATRQQEQENELNNFFIKPEIILKYAKYNHISNTTTTYTYNGRDLCTFMYQNVASKTLHDENIKYRDEHSSPFSYRTKSQMNLSMIVTQNSDSSEPPDSCQPFKATNFPSGLFSVIPTLEKLNSKPDNDELENSKDVAKISSQNNILSRRDSHKNKSIYEDTDTGSGCYFVPDEKTNLLLDHFESNAISNSSSTELYEDENDAKDLSQAENTKLLSAEVEIPKGFDFLSNW
ncbi:uncharacterized protein C1orf198 homolog [Drosophila willistoni]|uniref:uncharacterized protein C1orf198 homolog n=1 Tax=Drosophila willistoni TaxID=7260 RepID=UPI001F0799F7|nr:uncharacterized protein C1orf198 homolog [Drosophila willistoni]